MCHLVEVVNDGEVKREKQQRHSLLLPFWVIAAIAKRRCTELGRKSSIVPDREYRSRSQGINCELKSDGRFATE